MVLPVGARRPSARPRLITSTSRAPGSSYDTTRRRGTYSPTESIHVTWLNLEEDMHWQPECLGATNVVAQLQVVLQLEVVGGPPLAA